MNVSWCWDSISSLPQALYQGNARPALYLKNEGCPRLLTSDVRAQDSATLASLGPASGAHCGRPLPAAGLLVRAWAWPPQEVASWWAWPREPQGSTSTGCPGPSMASPHNSSFLTTLENSYLSCIVFMLACDGLTIVILNNL